MVWKETDKRLIRRGELILDPSFLESHEQELKTKFFTLQNCFSRAVQ